MPEQLDVEIALRDSISSGLRQVGREIDTITKNMRESAAVGTDAFAKFGKGAKEAKEASDKTKESVSGLHGFMTGMSRVLLGATGVAAGFIAVGDALGKFAQKRVQMEMLSIDLRMSNEQISVMRRALERMGADVGTQDRLLGTLGTKLHEVFTAGYHSPLIEHLSRMGGEGGTIAKLVESTKSGGDFFEATKIMLDRADEIKKRFGVDSPQLKEFADAMGWPVSYLQGMNKGMTEVKSSYIATYEVSKQTLDQMKDLEHEWQDMLTRIQEISMRVLIGMNKGFKDWIDRMKSTIDSIGESPAESQKRIPGYKPKQMGTFGLEDEGALPPNKTLNSYVIEGMREEDKKTNRLLGDIADTLQGFERNTRGSGGGYTSRSGLGTGIDLGGAARGYSSGGIPRVSSGGAPIGTAPMGLPRAIQGTPGLSRFAQPAGAHSQSGSSLSQSQHAPIQTQQPMPAGAAAVSPSGAGKTVRGSWYGQAPGWVDKGDRPNSNALGVPESMQGIALPSRSTLGQKFKVTTPDGREFITQQTDIGPAKRTGRGIDISAALADKMGYTSKNFPTGGKFTYVPETAQGVETAQGSGVDTGIIDSTGRSTRRFPKMSGDPQAIITHYTGGSTLKSAISTLNQRGLGYNYIVDRDGSIHRFVPEGSRGAHMLPGGGFSNQNTIGISAVGADEKSLTPEQRESMRNLTTQLGHKYGISPSQVFGHGEVNPGHRAIDEGRSTYQWARGLKSWPAQQQTDRNAIDESLKRKSATQSVKGSVKAEVDFSNAATAANKSGDELGKFKLLKITPAPQGAKDHEGLMTPGDLAHTPYVP